MCSVGILTSLGWPPFKRMKKKQFGDDKTEAENDTTAVSTNSAGVIGYKTDPIQLYPVGWDFSSRHRRDREVCLECFLERIKWVVTWEQGCFLHIVHEKWESGPTELARGASCSEPRLASSWRGLLFNADVLRVGISFSSSPSSSPSKGIASSGPCKSITIQFVTVVQSLCVCVCIKVTQLCPTLCSPMDYTLHGILQARILQWIFPTQGSNPVLPLQVDSLPAESH